MSVTNSYTFTSGTSFISDPDDVEYTVSGASLKLQALPDQHFVQTFLDDTGFTYDNTKAEFTGSLCRQKDQRQAGATFGVNYSVDINGNWGNGVLTGTASGGASVSGGKLDLTGGTKYVRYDAISNANSLQTGCVRFKFTPAYSGSPTAHNALFSISTAFGDYTKYIGLRHSSAGTMEMSVLDNDGAAIVSVYLGAWTPVSGTEYEFEMNWDITTGATRLFIDGVQLGATQTGTGTRSGSVASLVIGAHYTGGNASNGYFDDVLVFPTVQHIANYTPGYAVSSTFYAETTVTCPELHYTGAGTLLAFDSMIATMSNDPRFSIQIGRSGIYVYWNGSSWATSDGSYMQSNTMADFNAHCTTLDINGEIYGQPRIHFAASAIQQSITSFDAIVVGETYSTSNPTITLSQGFRIDALLAITASITATGSDAIKAVLQKDGINYYWSGTAWAVSSGYAQSNIIAEIETHKAAFTTIAIDFNIVLYLHAATGITTPSIQSLSITYDFAGEARDALNICAVYWYAQKADGKVCSETFTASLTDDIIIYKNNVEICSEEINAAADANGRVEFNLIDNVNMINSNGGVVYYLIKRGTVKIATISVPVSSGAMLWDITV